MSSKVYKTLILFGLIVSALIALFVWPIFRDIKRNSNAFIEGKNNLAELKNKIVAVANFQRNYADYAIVLDKMNSLFVDPNNPVDFIEYLEGAAARYNTKIGISFPTFLQGEAENQIVLTFFVTGEFSDILKFSENLENGPYLITIEGLDIQRKDDNSFNANTASINANFSIKALVK